ncbi:alpha/beta-hydrolase [Periconia macrospinosa]|uniref:Alpha/beta-hydrolase n=1 Tax=Periconia macrospinosa TaxID=97972 RepID=A0A2V1D5R2_9PLEO|nr:alpha/beta-hydrolase [Periconia macrospinosa]
MPTSILTSDPTLINIGTHSLALYAHGPEPKTSKDPVIFFVSGISSSRLNWGAVVRLLSPSLRSYTYDRSGYNNSEISPLPPTAENIALELSLLIERASITNPLILVGHSWAGVILCEFLARTGNGPHIAGLVLVDANHETALQVLEVNDPILWTVFAGVDFYSGTGIEAEHKLTPEEWAAFQSDQSTEKHQKAGEKESEQYSPSFPTLRQKGLQEKQPLLGDKPVYVIGSFRSRDWGNLYKLGVEKGNGTEEQRRHAREMIATADEKSEGLMRKHLKLSEKSKFVLAKESGHFIQLQQPDVVVDGIEWALSEIRDSASS